MSKIDVSQWGEFRVGDLLNFDSSKHIYHAENLDILDSSQSDFYYPYVVRSGFNNGVRGYINENPDTLNPGNTISFAQDTAQLFYQSAPYFTGNKVKICSLKDEQELTKSISLFLIACLIKSFSMFSWDSSFNVTNLKRVKIKLPITSDGKPDWNYMDHYISELAVRAHKDVSSLNQVKPKPHKININNWKEFKVGDLFDVRPSKYIRENGKAMTNAELFDNGDNPVIVNSSSDNGIGGYTTQKVTERGGVITYSDTTDGPDTMFYQSKPFVGYSHVKVMEPRDGVRSNFESMLYLTAVIKKALQQKDYTFANKLTTPLMKNTTIQLPVDDDGQPNWQYMESYIANCAALRHREVTALRVKDIPVFVGNWQNFKIGDVFDIQKGRRLIKSNQMPGTTPFVGASADNHGITAYIGQKPIFNANTITVSYNGSVGQVFYQEEPYWASDDINVLSLKDEYDDLNGGTALFFCACIQRAGQSFGYTDKWTVNKMKCTSISLPVTQSGQPDFDYMTKYIETIQASAKCRLQNYHNVDK